MRAADIDVGLIRRAYEATARDGYAVGFDRAAQTTASVLRTCREDLAHEVPRGLCHNVPFGGEMGSADAALNALSLHLRDLGVALTNDNRRQLIDGHGWNELPAPEPQNADEQDYEAIGLAWYRRQRDRSSGLAS